MTAMASAIEIETLAASFQKHARRADDGTIAFSAGAELLGVSEPIASALQQTVAYINDGVKRGVFSIDEQLSIRLTSQAENALAEPALSNEMTSPWAELTEAETTGLEVALGIAAAVAVIAGAVLTALLIYFGALLAAAIVAAIAVYCAINAIWLKIEIGIQRGKSTKNAVRIRWRYRGVFLDFFIANQVQVEPMLPLR